MVFTPNANDLLSILPALVLSGVGLVFLVIQFFYHSNEHRVIRFVTGGTILLAIYFLTLNLGAKPGKGIFFHGQVSISDVSFWLNVIYFLS